MARKMTMTEEDRVRIQEEQEARAQGTWHPHWAGAHEGGHYIPAVDRLHAEQYLGGKQNGAVFVPRESSGVPLPGSTGLC